MKDEIKEIIKNIELILNITTSDMVLLERKNIKYLLDNITNLQDTLKDREEYCYGLETQITNLQEEIERLKELDENYPIEEQLEEALKYENIYKSRNEKALDKLYCYGEVFDSKILQEFQKEMENILNGGDEE